MTETESSAARLFWDTKIEEDARKWLGNFSSFAASSLIIFELQRFSGMASGFVRLIERANEIKDFASSPPTQGLLASSITCLSWKPSRDFHFV
jgi:hypothetical protein